MTDDRQGRPEDSRDHRIMWAVMLVATAAGVPAALQAGRPVSTTLLGVLLLVALPALTLWQTIRGGLTRRPRHVVLSLRVISAAVLLGTATVVAVPAGRDLLLHKAFGWPDEATGIEQVLAVAPAPTSPTTPVEPTYRRARIVIGNPSARPRLVTHLEIASQRRVRLDCRSGESERRHTYTITGAVGLKSGRDQRFTGSAQEEVSAEEITDEEAGAAKSARSAGAASLPVDGRIRVPGCGTREISSISVSFDVTVALDPQSFTTIEVDFAPELLRHARLSGLNPRDMSVTATLGKGGEIRLRNCTEDYC
ncbi:hypothetical protein [Micromonospora foliorum]|uniref:hypothetical protein n=1 Tax=Micromonospora foliorum TaxID=2911210 RepID=UPI001EE7C458|nr:hypothetical protein [Micromonospora foliorum]